MTILAPKNLPGRADPNTLSRSFGKISEFFDGIRDVVEPIVEVGNSVADLRDKWRRFKGIDVNGVPYDNQDGEVSTAKQHVPVAAEFPVQDTLKPYILPNPDIYGSQPAQPVYQTTEEIAFGLDKKELLIIGGAFVALLLVMGKN